MGILGGIKERSRGAITPAKPPADIVPGDESLVRDRLLGISGDRIVTSERDGRIVIAWSANVAGVGAVTSEELHRAIEVELDAYNHVAMATCVTRTTTRARAGGMGRTWGRGLQLGWEGRRVLPWFGPHRSESGADERDYRFSWRDLRRPVIDTVIGAGWTYKPIWI